MKMIEKYLVNGFGETSDNIHEWTRGRKDLR